MTLIFLHKTHKKIQGFHFLMSKIFLLFILLHAYSSGILNLIQNCNICHICHKDNHYQIRNSRTFLSFSHMPVMFLLTCKSMDTNITRNMNNLFVCAVIDCFYLNFLAVVLNNDFSIFFISNVVSNSQKRLHIPPSKFCTIQVHGLCNHFYIGL